MKNIFNGFHRCLIVLAMAGLIHVIDIDRCLLAAEQQAARHHSLIHRQSSDLQTVEPATSSSPTGAASSMPAPRPQPRKLTKRPAQTIPSGTAGDLAQTTAPTAASARIPSTRETSKAGSGSRISMAPTALASAGTSVLSMTGSASSASTSPTLSSTIPVPATKSALGAISGRGAVSAVSSGAQGAGGRGMQRLAGQLPVSQIIAPTVTVSSTPAPLSPPQSSSAPPSSAPSTTVPPPPSSAQRGTGGATLSWTSNSEPDLAGYKLYVGTAPGVYMYQGSPFVIGLTGSHTISGLPIGQTYYFALSAFDSTGNESGLSSEVSKSLY